MQLIQCCSLPEYFKTEIKDKCIEDCSDVDYKANPWCCMTECLVEKSNIGSNGSFNITKIKTVIKAAFNSTSLKKVEFLININILF